MATNKVNESYFPRWDSDKVKVAVKDAAPKIKNLQSILAEQNETLADALEYLKKGWDWKIKKVEKECNDWMNTQHTPQYLRSEYLAKARGSVPCDYYKKVGNALSISASKGYGNPIPLNLAKDIDVPPSGEWALRSDWEAEQMEAIRYTLTDDEQKAFDDYKQLLKAYNSLRRRGWDLREMLPWGDSDSEKELDAESFMECYSVPQTK